ncbi:two-component response regulator ssk1p [Grosmannia clavigera kw1407]|uniref:Two-component response regulator ssk1p n=1 Tax=Grosmannia clavigera (strain kw1407 / UAMH 11150) TaxID=655863 RepID=F0XBU5_GROCL|nr:two-component response regulator ssk1p [Grosmannia clavigera kw1407]EFX04838.1 two-component response regulator ssk1p [Grosmannia clavigera kw1407]
MAAAAPTQKVWVRRPGASATLVTFSERDVVDDVRETLLHKYGNSLGRVYDAPDITLRLIPRADNQTERTLGPDEPMAEVLENTYAGGQTIEEALIIDVPLRRITPSSSPQAGRPDGLYAVPVGYTTSRDSYSSGYETRTDYFGPGAVAASNHSHGYSHGHSHGHGHNHGHGYSHGPSSHILQTTFQRHAHAHPLNLHLQAPPPSASGGVTNGRSSQMPQAVGGGANGGSNGGGGSPHHHPHSISVLATGQVPPIPNLPSPNGSRWQQKDRSDRPKLHRQISANGHVDGSGSLHEYVGQGSSAAGGAVPGSTLGVNVGQLVGQLGSGPPNISLAAPISGSSVLLGTGDGGPGAISGSPGTGMAGDVKGNGDGGSSNNNVINGNAGISVSMASPSPHNGTSSPRPASPLRTKRLKKPTRQMDDDSHTELRLGPLTVPPINVLIVEDNIINLKLLEAFIKRLKVRWQTAMNGRDAVLKWRTGGFHLVLMDIQLPLMSGLEATREIRRLERVNSIGVFASTPSDNIGNGRDPRSDKLENMSLFKSPVIIVALTASSLQSDRNDALAAGCNDFLTKPVNFVWLEKKIMEWGCMQALIDFDGWRSWKELKLPSLPSHEAADANGTSSDSGTKKSKKHIGHAKRLSMSSVIHETAGGDSLNTIKTLSLADGTASGLTARSPLSASADPSERSLDSAVSPQTSPETTQNSDSPAVTPTIAPQSTDVASAA